MTGSVVGTQPRTFTMNAGTHICFFPAGYDGEKKRLFLVMRSCPVTVRVISLNLEKKKKTNPRSVSHMFKSKCRSEKPTQLSSNSGS